MLDLRVQIEHFEKVINDCNAHIYALENGSMWTSDLSTQLKSGDKIRSEAQSLKGKKHKYSNSRNQAYKCQREGSGGSHNNNLSMSNFDTENLNDEQSGSNNDFSELELGPE